MKLATQAFSWAACRCVSDEAALLKSSYTKLYDTQETDFD